jgi:ATP-dependent DNA helicase DinG
VSDARVPTPRPDPRTVPGTEGTQRATPAGARTASGAGLSLAPEAARRIRAEITKAGGREVCFLAHVDEARVVRDPRAVARGNFGAVLVAARDASSGDVMVHNHPSGTLEPSDADLNLAASLYELGLGTAITDNEASTLYVVVEPPKPRVRVPIDLDSTAELLGPGGPLSSIHPGFEDRPGQREVLRLIAERYNEGGIALVEAGTGTGKSLAYLLPAAEWADLNQERTVVSTNTINLQEQLVSKDLPLVERILGRTVNWALVKGRGNYVSIRRALLAGQSVRSLFEDDRGDELDQLLRWIEVTEDGSLSDLPAVPGEDLWEEVRSDADVCLRTKCSHFQECFYQRARRRAASAELLVVNHHLLFSDLAVRRSSQNFTQSAVLPAYRHLILDEAHNVEDAATTHLGVQVTRRGLFRLLSRLERRGKGVLRATGDEAGASDVADQLRDRIEDRVRPALDDARECAVRFTESLEDLLPPGEIEPRRIGDERFREPTDHVAVREALEALLAALARLEREARAAREFALDHTELEERLRGRLLDLLGVERRLNATAQALRVVLDPSQTGGTHVRWIERRGRGRRSNLVLAAAPIALGPVLRENLFEKVESATLLSATLATSQGFDFTRERLGLVDREGDELGSGTLEVLERLVPSPFDYASQTVLCVPAGLAGPGAETGDFQQEIASVVTSLAERSGGGVLVLFTSFKSLRRVATLLRQSGVDAKWSLFVQGEDDRSRLLRSFERARNAILLGTSSFWEGVDVPGEPLRALVLEKLPFKVPTEPVTAARLEALEAAGRNSFWSYMLPHAALRLKQGFGRLIRSNTDRGAVLLLDDRILSRRYGRYLRESLPPAPLVKGPWWDVERALTAFYGASASDAPGGLS